MTNPRTIARLESRILERAAHCVEFELADPRITLVTLTGCELTNDLASVRIKYSVMGSDADQRRTHRALEDAAGFVQRQVGRVLRTRRIPRITWIFDESVRLAAEMDAAIRAAIARDEAIKSGAIEDSDADADEDGVWSDPDHLDARTADQLAEDEYQEFLDERRDEPAD
ncbi:Ribosome-binding factor A [Planctomycetes bacterium Pla163]|uniref:Ribosome-binding factor A n=1 Tax=Rohdeia mirabilis TaxID=2528008 RepID=A0A518CZE9_9BACT|nr:Ribosome-binding factor A [Planctomycetes bacterium Pla163]